MRPWPPPRGLSAALDLLLELEPAPPVLPRAEAERLFTTDIVISVPPLVPSHAFRHYFGIDGVLDAYRAWGEHPEIVTVPVSWAFAGPHGVVVCRVERAGQTAGEAAWLCLTRDGRVQTLRGFRYLDDALLRLRAIASE